MPTSTVSVFGLNEDNERRVNAVFIRPDVTAANKQRNDLPMRIQRSRSRWIRAIIFSNRFLIGVVQILIKGREFGLIRAAQIPIKGREF
jgi:hypothetical protein